MFGFQMENETKMTNSLEDQIFRHAEMVAQVKLPRPDLISV